MRKLLFALLAAFFVLALLSGCTALTSPSAEPVATEQLNSGCARRMVDAIRSGDYAPLAGHLAPRVAELITEENFKALRAELAKCGELEQTTFVTTLRLPIFRTEVWKLTYVRKAQDNSTIYHEKLLHITTGKLDGREKITGIAVQ